MERRILATAAELFRTKGYAQSTTRELAGMIGLKKASLYHYVQSKEDLLYEISIESLQQMQSDPDLEMRQMADAELPVAKAKIEALEKKYDAQFRVVFDAIRELMAPPSKPRRPIGFKP